MKFRTGCWLILFLAAACGEAPAPVAPPEPYGVLPTAAQIEWQKMEYYLFVHFGINTFTNEEWGSGQESPAIFNPTELDCRQWAATAKAAGMKAIIITAKHHDGFCLWPSKYSRHTVRESRWKNGKGDVLRELSDACKEYGLKFGVYLSPWDRNHPSFGTPEYNRVFVNTLEEVLTNYGDVFEQWFDGANKGKKQVYDWALFNATIYKHQPHAVIFSDVGPGCRWMGNEAGVAGETNWSRLNVEGYEPGIKAPKPDVLNRGNMLGAQWIPAEVDVSIRSHWFYTPYTDNSVKPVEELMAIYHTSVGRNANLLLNVPPDRRGKIPARDSARLMEFKAALDRVYATDLAKGATLTASHERGAAFAAANLLNNDYDSYWAVGDEVFHPSLEVRLDKVCTFNRLVLQEYIPLGQRVAKFNVEAWDGKAWKEIASGTTIGYKRILCFPAVTTYKLRITIQNSLACPVLNKIALYRAPAR